MKNELFNLIDKLQKEHTLTEYEYEKLITNYDSDLLSYSAEKAREEAQKHYGNEIYIRGLIEISSFCKNDCYYCGIRKSNKNCSRYRLTKDEILECCDEGYGLGFRTFVSCIQLTHVTLLKSPEFSFEHCHTLNPATLIHNSSILA